MKTTSLYETNQLSGSVVTDYDLDLVAEKLHNMINLRKEIEEEEARLKKFIEAYCARNDKTSWIGSKFVYSTYERKGAINYELITILEQIDLEHYRKKPVTCWKLTKL